MTNTAGQTLTGAEVGAGTAEMLVELVDRHPGSLDLLKQEHSEQGSKTPLK